MRALPDPGNEKDAGAEDDNRKEQGDDPFEKDMLVGMHCPVFPICPQDRQQHKFCVEAKGLPEGIMDACDQQGNGDEQGTGYQGEDEFHGDYFPSVGGMCSETGLLRLLKRMVQLIKGYQY